LRPNQHAFPISDDHPAWDIPSRASAFSAVLPGRGCPRDSAFVWKAEQEMMLCDHQNDGNMTRSQAADNASACSDLPHPPPRPHRCHIGRIDTGPAVLLTLVASSSTNGSAPDPVLAAAATARSTGSGPDLGAAATTITSGGDSGCQLPLRAFESRYATAYTAAAAARAAGPRSLPCACVPEPPPPPAYTPEPLPPLRALTATHLSVDSPLQRLMLAMQLPAAGVAGSWTGEHRSLPGFRAYPAWPGLAGPRGAM
jgi:hypothetical protein